MGLGGGLAEAELGGDLGVGEAPAHEAEHVLLPLGEAVDAFGRSRRCGSWNCARMWSMTSGSGLSSQRSKLPLVAWLASASISVMTEVLGAFDV